MKLCYLILAHNNISILNLIIRALSTPHCNFIIHIDKKCDDISNVIKNKSIHLLQDRKSVDWGGISIVETVYSC